MEHLEELYNSSGLLASRITNGFTLRYKIEIPPQDQKIRELENGLADVLSMTDSDYYADTIDLLRDKSSIFVIQKDRD